VIGAASLLVSEAALPELVALAAGRSRSEGAAESGTQEHEEEKEALPGSQAAVSEEEEALPGSQAAVSESEEAGV